MKPEVSDSAGLTQICEEANNGKREERKVLESTRRPKIAFTFLVREFENFASGKRFGLALLFHGHTCLFYSFSRFQFPLSFAQSVSLLHGIISLFGFQARETRAGGEKKI